MSAHPRLAVVVSALVATACSFTHTYQLRGADVNPSNAPGLNGKRVAVIFLEPEIRPEYVSTTVGNNFVFQKTHDYLREGIEKAFKSQLATLDFYDAPPPDRYDAYVYPALELQVTRPVDTKRRDVPNTCAAKLGMLVLDRTGKKLYGGTTSQVFDFPMARNADQACKVAILRTFPEVVGGAFGAVAGMSPPSDAPAVVPEPAAALAAPPTGEPQTLPGARLCIPGQAQACVGPGGCAGGQACQPDGMAFGACDCGTARRK